MPPFAMNQCPQGAHPSSFLMKKISISVALGLLLTACCGSKSDPPKPTPAPVAVKTTAPTATASARPCSAMSTAGDCAACCGTAYRASFRGIGTCACTKL